MVEFMCRFLREVSISSSFNLTATRAVSGWLSSALAGASSTFDELRNVVQSLSLATSLRRGHHMGVLWRSFLSEEGDDELRALERDLRAKLRSSSCNILGGLSCP
jgi:hypothetical protein